MYSGVIPSEIIIEISQETKSRILYDLAVHVPPGHIHMDCRSAYIRHLHTPVYHSTVHNSQAVESAEGPSAEARIKEMWYICTMEYHSAIKKEEIMSFIGKWMTLERIILSEISQAQKDKFCIFCSYVESRPK
jgi:hypothetical protein